MQNVPVLRPSREPIAHELEDEIHGEAQTPNCRFAVADRGINMNSVEGHDDTVRDFEMSRKSGAEGLEGRKGLCRRWRRGR